MVNVAINGSSEDPIENEGLIRLGKAFLKE